MTGKGVVLQDGASAAVMDCDLTGNTRPMALAGKCVVTQRGNAEVKCSPRDLLLLAAGLV